MNGTIQTAIGTVAKQLRSEGFDVGSGDASIIVRASGRSSMDTLRAGKARSAELLRAALPGRTLCNERSRGESVWTWTNGTDYGHACGVRVALTECEQGAQIAGLPY